MLAAVRVARRIVRDLGGRAFSISKKNKAAYHAWGGFISPLLVLTLVAGEKVARAAGLSAADTRKNMLPIVRQTLANYSKLRSGRRVHRSDRKGRYRNCAQASASIEEDSGSKRSLRGLGAGRLATSAGAEPERAGETPASVASSNTQRHPERSVSIRSNGHAKSKDP